MSRKLISPEKAILLRNRYERERGVTLDQLAKEHNVTHPTIASAIRRQGGKIRTRGRKPEIKKVPKGSQLLEKLNTLAEISGGVYPNRDTVKCVVDYALRHNDGRTFRKIDRLYNYNGLFSQFRREHLENSYYVMGRLWRAVYQQVFLTCKNGGKVNPEDYSVTKDDLLLCIGMLTDADRAKIISWLDEHPEYIRFPNEKGVQKIVDGCEKTMRSIVSSKLRFIYKYDPAYEAEDLVNYLRIIAYRVASKYDWEMLDGEFAYLKCLNYTKRSLWNAAFLIIKENTGEDYNRITNVGSGEREYQTTTISMDSVGLDEDSLSMEDILGEDADTSFEVTDLIEKVDDPSLFTYLRLEQEEVPEFTEFVRKSTGKDENDLYAENYKKWKELAQRFSGLPTDLSLDESKMDAIRALGF